MGYLGKAAWLWYKGSLLTVSKPNPYTAEMPGAVIKEPEAMTRLVLDLFAHLGMVERFKGTLLLPNREKRQSEDRLKEMLDQTAQGLQNIETGKGWKRGVTLK